MNLRNLLLSTSILIQLLGGAVYGQQIEPLNVVQETYELQLPVGPNGEIESVKLEISKAKPESLEQLIAAEKWIEADEIKKPSQFRMVIDSIGTNLSERFQKLFRSGPAVKTYEIVQDIASDTRTGLQSDSAISDLKSKFNKKVQELEVVAAEKSKRIAIEVNINGNKFRATKYDFWLAKYRFFGNFGAYTASLATTIPVDQAVAIGTVAVTMSLASAKVQAFSNYFGNWLERKGMHYRMAALPSKLAAVPASLFINSEARREKFREFAREKISYYAKYMEFEAIFVSMLYGMLTVFDHQPDLDILTYLAIKVPMATMSQGVLEEYFLRKRAKDMKVMPEIGAKLRYSTKVFVVSVLTNGAVALSSLSPDVSWIGNAMLVGLAGTGISLFIKDSGITVQKVGSGIKSSLSSLVSRPLEKIKNSATVHRVANSCFDLLNAAVPPPPILPGITVPN